VNTIGAVASGRWLDERGLDASRTPHWYVEISIGSDSADTRFELNIYPEEWGYQFRRGARVSSIRVTDIAFVHGFDDYRLLADTPPLDRIEDLLVTIERRCDIGFRRDRPTVHSNLARAAMVVRSWLESRA
jgi:hypothetical protein